MTDGQRRDRRREYVLTAMIAVAVANVQMLLDLLYFRGW